MPAQPQIHPGSPRDPRAVALLQASHDLMLSLFDAEDNHALSLDALCAPDIRFFVAETEDRLVGCGALAIRDGWGEVKAMYVDPTQRGLGLGLALLNRIEQEARAVGLSVLRLETGTGLDAAIALYERVGFVTRPAFAPYEPAAASVFMEKRLADQTGSQSYSE